MRLLLITNEFPNPHQPTKALFNLHLARALSKAHEVKVVSPIAWVDEWSARRREHKGLEVSRTVVLNGVEVHHPRYYYPPRVLRRRYGWCYWRSVRATVWRLLHAHRPDAVVGYWAHPDGQVAVHIARMLGVPSVVIVGGSDVLLLPQQHGRRRCVVKVLNDADAVLAVSRDLQAKTVELGIPANKVHVWSRGVDTEIFAPGDRSDARRRLGINVEGKVLVWVGRMVPVKAVDVLLDATAKLHSRGMDFRLYLVGDGPLRQSLEAQVRDAFLVQKVRFVGSQDHRRVADWYRAADLTVLPSLSEGIPNTLRESLACGTPFVASRVGGISEIADEPANRLVSPGDSTALAEAIEQALTESGTMVRSQPFRCEESAAWLVEILRPLVAKAQDCDRPWWSSNPAGTVKAATRINPWGPRQIARTAMAALLPHRLFMVRGRRTTNCVSLTFDDGPHPEHTPRLLDTLKSNGVKATFFVVGRQAERYPDLVRRIAAEGHDVANHSFFHTDVRLMSAREAVQGILKTQQLLRQLVGDVPPLYRPPRGKLTLGKLLRLWWAGMKVVLWNVDPRDYSCKSNSEMADWFRSNPLQGGDILLLHDRLPFAGAVLPEVIAATRQRGLDFVPISHWM
jgi:teichuronic acid biosynthesis glycosyltransferase TuaC